MSFIHCATCGHVFSYVGNDIPHAESFMEVNHGGGQCRSCYLKAGRWECRCGTILSENMKFCHQCGVKRL